MTDAATAERPWLGLTEAAGLTGLDREALRSRARRGLLPSRKGNRGQLLVQVPADLADGHDHADDRDDRGADRDPAGMRVVMTDLVAEVGELRVALARAEADRDAATGHRDGRAGGQGSGDSRAAHDAGRVEAAVVAKVARGLMVPAAVAPPTGAGW
jgi:hypothetical protein